ncbi:glycosyltransferase family 9 protein [Salinactinospora qingdaonensis]|uniref:Glycosyltransferase family 9 protein n=1 Tax=Salinactinospora qingdaonensis TaxID=702744 RepID=A0ABP7FLE6_9ACTN
MPAVRALTRAFPHHRLTVAGPPAYADFLTLAGVPHRVLDASGPETPQWPEARPPDLAVNLHGHGPESIAALHALRPRELWSYAHPDFPDLRGPRWPAGEHDVDLWCRMLGYYGVRADPTDLRLWAPPQPSRRPGAVLLHPGAAFPARRWPELRFAQVARWLRSRGHEVVVTGSRSELPLALRVARVAGLDERAVMAGRTSPNELAALVAESTMVICGDTGVAQLATAYATPSVVLFGAAHPEVWGPRIDPWLHICLRLPAPRQPRRSRTHHGLLRITDNDVIAAAEELFARLEAATAAQGPPRPRTAAEDTAGARSAGRP